MTYRAPIEEISFALREITDIQNLLEHCDFEDVNLELVDTILEEAGKFAEQEIAPLNVSSDQQGAHLKDGKVELPQGWKETYQEWTQAGWNALACIEEYGGQPLPHIVRVATTEFWNSACMALALGPLLTQGAIEAIEAHASDELKSVYLENLISGRWMGTMNLTEPHAGSDLSVLRTKAVPCGNGSYKITGTKIFITFGDHEMTDNIIHLVLARLPDAPSGTRGLSLFLVPKYLVNDDGSLGERNDVIAASLEHKLGTRGTPTCVMSYGDKGGAIGYLVGEENKGMSCMFTMMNNARLNVGVQGVAICERAYQQALLYATDRKQGKAPDSSATGMSPIIEHPDVKRMLMTMRAKTQASRAICFETAKALDLAKYARDEKTRENNDLLASLLTPIAKSYASDCSVQVASEGIQIHGGMGFIEETGAAQHLRDARILPIYEGTNGIQALDLIGRKLSQRGGAFVRGYIGDLRRKVEEVNAINDPSFGEMGQRLSEAVDALDEATEWMLQSLQSNDTSASLASATPYQELFGITIGGVYLATGALKSRQEANNDNKRAKGRINIARHFCENLLTNVTALQKSVMKGAGSILSMTTDQLAI